MYVNGVLDNSAVLNGSVISSNSTNFRVGSSAHASAIQRFNGLIDDVRLYNRALSKREINDLYRWNPLGNGGTILTTLRIESGAALQVAGTISGAALNVMHGNSYLLGNVGIGKSGTPNTKLEVAGTISGSLITQNGAGSNYMMGSLGVGVSPTAGYALDVNGNMLVKSAGTNYGFIGKSGTWISDASTNFAIASYQTNLNLYANNSTTAGLRVFGTYASGKGLVIDDGASTNYGFMGKSGTWEGNADAHFGLASYTSSLKFYTNGSTTPSMTVTSTGLGIGKTSPATKLDVAGTISGTVIYGQSSLRSSGSLAWEGAGSGASLYVQTFEGAGLTDCDLTNNTLKWDATTKKFICSTAAGSFGSGNILTLGDARYVKKAGDTMTGALQIRPTLGVNTVGLNVAATMSGRALRISGTGSRPMIDVPSGSSVVNVNAPLEQGLIGWWGMDRLAGTGVSIQDLSINTNTGTLTNGPTLATGRLGKAVWFDGTNDHMTVANESAYDLSATATYSAWFKANAGARKILAKGDGSNAGYEIDINGFTAGHVECAVMTTGGNYLFRGAAYIPNVWNHVTCTFDASQSGNDKLKIYLNGAAVTGTVTSLGTVTVIGLNNFPVTIGTSSASSPPYYNGLIDDVRIYNRALSKREVNDLYRWNPLGDGGTILSTLRIESGASLNVAGVVSGAVLYGRQTLASSGSLVWEGAGSGASLYVQTFEGAGLTDCDLTANVLKWDSTTKKFLCTTGADTFGSGNVLTIGDARYVKKAGDTMTGALTINVTGGNVNTLGLKVINTASGAHLHAEKTLSSSGTIVSEGNITIGSGSLWQPVYNSLNEGLVGFWSFSETGSTTTYDRSPYGNDGSLTNGPTYVAGKFGTALSFDGNNDYVTISDARFPSGTSARSICLWGKPNGNFNGLGMVYGAAGTATSVYIGMYNLGSGYNAIVGVGGAGGNVGGVTAINDNQWHHLCATYDSTTWRLYVDGRLDASGTPTTNTTLSSGFIGYNTSETWKGLL